MIYLDNASTTKPSAEAVTAAVAAMEQFGNPSSLHGLGLSAEKLVEKSRCAVADALGAESKRVFLLSGGTEANNTAIIGTARAKRRRGLRVITSKIEHPSVLESFRTLENEGFDVVYIGAQPSGVISMDELRLALNESTTLVSIMTVNNETGIMQPIEEIAELTHAASGDAVFHTDAVQALGKTDCSVRKTGADLVSVSAHKIHGLKGVGALYIGSVKPEPLIHGGSQQGGVRPGTENVPGISAFGAALEGFVKPNDTLYDTLKAGILSEIPNVLINGAEEYCDKCVLNVSFLGIKAEVLLHTLENYEIYVSTGSACSSHRPEPSHVLTAMGLTKKETEGAVRFSFDSSLTVRDMEETVSVLKKEVAQLRRYMR